MSGGGKSTCPTRRPRGEPATSHATAPNARARPPRDLPLSLRPLSSARLHTDKCVGLQAVAGSSEPALVQAYPLVSSVLYLTSEGGPTVVFDQTLESAPCDSGADSSHATPMAAAQVAICAPRRSRLLLFDGRLLHAVLHRPGGLASGLRKTLLINWWAAQPPGVVAAPRWMLANCAPSLTVPLVPNGTDDETAEPFELVRLEYDRDDVETCENRPTARVARAAAARFLADVRECWLHQRAPAKVALAYAASVQLDRPPLILARYAPTRLSGLASEALGSPREVAELASGIVRARRGGSGRDEEPADASDQHASECIETELREVWPP